MNAPTSLEAWAGAWECPAYCADALTAPDRCGHRSAAYAVARDYAAAVDRLEYLAPMPADAPAAIAAADAVDYARHATYLVAVDVLERLSCDIPAVLELAGIDADAASMAAGEYPPSLYAGRDPAPMTWRDRTRFTRELYRMAAIARRLTMAAPR